MLLSSGDLESRREPQDEQIEQELSSMKALPDTKWLILTCMLLLVWQLLLDPLTSSHTDEWVSTGINLVVQLAAGVALIAYYRRHSLTKGQLVVGLISVASMAAGTALLATTAPGGSVGDAVLVMCGTAVWVVLTLWIIVCSAMAAAAG